jgi:hypothetical protein
MCPSSFRVEEYAKQETCFNLDWFILQPWRWRWHVPVKYQLTFTRLHGVTIPEDRILDKKFIQSFAKVKYYWNNNYK